MVREGVEEGVLEVEFRGNGGWYKGRDGMLDEWFGGGGWFDWGSGGWLLIC